MKRCISLAALFLLLNLAQLAVAGSMRLSKEVVSDGMVISDSKPLTLLECYQRALKQSETIAINAELIKEAEAHFQQAFGTLLPNVYFVSDQMWEDPRHSSGAVQRETYQRGFVFSQTLFSGFKEFAGMAGSKAERRERVNEKLRAEQLLFADVSDAFYLFKEQKEDLRILESIEGALKDRVHELLDRQRLGRSRKSETASTQAQLYSSIAQISLSKTQLEVSRQLLEFLTGVRLEDCVDTQPLDESLQPMDAYLAKAAMRPDVLAAQDALILAQKGSAVARSGFFPTIAWQNNYYTSRTTTPRTSRWDALLSVSIPVFDLTNTWGALDLANAKAGEAALQLRLVRRTAAQNIRDAYVQFSMSLAQREANKNAADASEISYLLQKEDYSRSLINNLELLQTLQAMQEAERDLNHSIYEAKRQYWQLRLATGTIPIL